MSDFQTVVEYAHAGRHARAERTASGGWLLRLSGPYKGGEFSERREYLDRESTLMKQAARFWVSKGGLLRKQDAQ